MGKRRIDVYGIGNAIMDLQISSSEAEFSKLDLEKGSMRLVAEEEQARLLEHYSGKDIHQASGGSAANTMIGIAQLGGRTVYGCVLGDDSFGKAYREEMLELGVELYTEAVSGGTSGSCIVLITPDAERTMNTHLGASADFGPQHVQEGAMSEAEWLYVEGYLFSSDSGFSGVKEAVSAAKRLGTKVAVTVSDGFIIDCFSEQLNSVLKDADLVFANYSEAQKLTGETEEDKVFSSLSSIVPNAVMTMGARGVRLVYDGTLERVEAFSTAAVDTTGAGDMFAGGFMFGITHGLSGFQSGRLGSFLASRVVSQLGPRLGGDVKKLAVENDCLSG